jgi:hypothetical protein
MSDDERVAFSKLLSRIAADLERRGYPGAGAIRRAAIGVVVADAPPDRCVCGRALVHPPTGRRRKWCSERCRRRARP